MWNPRLERLWISTFCLCLKSQSEKTLNILRFSLSEISVWKDFEYFTFFLSDKTLKFVRFSCLKSRSEKTLNILRFCLSEKTLNVFSVWEYFEIFVFFLSEILVWKDFEFLHFTSAWNPAWKDFRFFGIFMSSIPVWKDFRFYIPLSEIPVWKYFVMFYVFLFWNLRLEWAEKHWIFLRIFFLKRLWNFCNFPVLNSSLKRLWTFYVFLSKIPVWKDFEYFIFFFVWNPGLKKLWIFYVFSYLKSLSEKTLDSLWFPLSGIPVWK